jgi:hypothetical protein
MGTPAHHVYCSTIHNNQVIGSAHMTINRWMDRDNVVYTPLYLAIREWITCRKMHGTRDHHVKWNKPNSERQVVFIASWFSFGISLVYRNLSISSRFSSLSEYKFSKYSLMILRISLVFVVILPVSCLI